MRNFKNLESFITETPTYVKEELTVQDVQNISQTKNFRVDVFCVNCNQPSIFEYNDESWCGSLIDVDARYTFDGVGLSTNNAIPVQEEPKQLIYKSLELICARCRYKYQYFFTTNRKFIMKVGQFPSFAEVNSCGIDKYKNLIPKYFIEFKSSFSCYSQGKGIAAFVYLRRILEDLVEKIYNNKVEDKEENEKFIDKFKKVQQIEKVLPEEMADIQNALYSVLSKGIHEYEEDECLKLYEAVKFVIEEILDKQLIEKQKQDKIKEVKKTLNTKLKEKNNG